MSSYIHHDHADNKFTKDKLCGLKDNTGMGIWVQVEITRRKRGFNRQVQKILLCNGPSTTTPNKPLIVRNCFKLYLLARSKTFSKKQYNTLIYFPS
jgi:hypothetical protein